MQNSELQPPFGSRTDLHDAIDATTAGNIPPWQSFTLSYTGELGDGPVASWKRKEFEVFFRDPRLMLHSQLGNPGFAGEMDFAPKKVFDKNDKREYQDFMSGNWSWRQAVSI
jgi:hypothetical protein